MDDFGSDFITITDEDGVEYELEVLSTVEYKGSIYYALVPAAAEEDDDPDLEVCILKNISQDGESFFEAVRDDAELEAVYHLFEDQFYADEDADSL